MIKIERQIEVIVTQKKILQKKCKNQSINIDLRVFIDSVV